MAILFYVKKKISSVRASLGFGYIAVYIWTLETSQKTTFYTGKKGNLAGLVSTARAAKM